jgi:hypothetical protein
MGAWGEGPFDNDDALDLLYLLDAEPRAVLLDLLQRVAVDEGEISATTAAMTVAAAALIGARRLGTSVHDPSANEWLAAHTDFEVDAELIDTAAAALRRVDTASELRDLMDEAELLDEWNEENSTVLGQLGHQR